MENKMKILNPVYSLKLKNIILFLTRVLFFYKWSYSQRCFNVVQRCEIYSENGSVLSMLSDVVQINVEVGNVDSMLFNVVNFNVDVHNVVSTLIWRCAMSRRHINLKTTLKRRWNARWEKKVAKKAMYSTKPLLNWNFCFKIRCYKWEVSEAVVRRCSVNFVLLETSQNSQENICARDSFLIKLQASGNFF